MRKDLLKKDMPVFVAIVLGITLLLLIPRLVYRSFLNSEYAAEPSVKQAEFPFKLVYRVGEEIVTVEDTYVCEYRGKEWTLDMGVFRVWRGYIKGMGSENVLAWKNSSVAIEISVGTCDFYMSLSDSEASSWTPKFVVTDKDGWRHAPKETLPDAYDIEILSFEHADPIETLPMEDGVADLVR